MNTVEATPALDEFMSVTFVPLAKVPAPAAPARIDFRSRPVLDQIVTEMSEPLADLTRRIRRVGAVDGGVLALVTGCQRGVGCTTVALALAAVAAAEQDVLLVDGDFAKPGLARLLGMSPPMGWDETVRGLGDPDHAIQYFDAEKRLAVLPLKQPVREPAEPLHSQVALDWIARFRQSFGLIIVDGGSVWDSGSNWAGSADVGLVVCDSDHAAADEWARAWDRLEESGAHVLGIVETFV